MTGEVRVAVATSNGTDVDEHFGRARSFTVFLLRDGTHRFLERRTNEPPCAGTYHSDELLERTADLLHDCRAVAAARIGPGAIDVLLTRGILPLALETSIEEALATLHDSKFL